jgi:threonine dehydrogenase-like Zn-dependent dehydrogenase
MPLELIADRPGHAALQEYAEPPLLPDQVRIRSLFSSVKHGTELRGFRRDSADAHYPWNEELRLHDRERQPPRETPLRRRLGNMCLGVVTEAGAQVQGLQIGHRVFGHLPIRETHTVPEGRVRRAPEGVSPWGLMYWDPASFGVGGVRDGHVRLGDRVAVFGLGAIGQMVVQLARLAGARWVVALDPIERRRSAAARHGADLVLDPRAVDAGLELKRQTEKVGVDVALETSGSSHALHDALRSVRYQGTIVSTAYYTEPMQGLLFAGEWHRNRPNLLSSRACSEPLPDFGWDFARVGEEALALLVEGRLQAEDLIDPIVPFTRAAEAYEEINEHPERSIKLGIEHERSS